MSYRWMQIAAMGLLVALTGPGAGRSADTEPSVAIRERFDTLDAWKPLTFPKISRHTTYTIEVEGENRVLRADADASASAIVHTSRFAVRQFPEIRWRWKIQRPLAKGDARTRAGDDYPMRVYVIFEYDPEQASLGERIQYGAAKAIYGQYPPHSSLNYIWANREHAETILPNAYTDRARMFPLQQGGAKAGQWVQERRNILADYRQAFGTDPPRQATVAIMADT
ncbi:MAG: DUF3047 domain-containing protein, partial [Desulfobacteraceae bacterium]|nr:DUF3047 domain-containing protein [Desulfobacteraceae bacterium]